MALRFPGTCAQCVQANKHFLTSFAGEAELKAFLGRLDPDYAELAQAGHSLDQASPARPHVLFHVEKRVMLAIQCKQSKALFARHC